MMRFGPLISASCLCVALLVSISPATANIGPSQHTIAERLMNDVQAELNLERHQAAGLIGNLGYESGNFKTLQEGKPMVEGSRGGWGYAQWTADRRVNFERYADSLGLARDSYEANKGFLVHEMTTSYRNDLESLKRTTTVEEASMVVMKEYLIPHPPTAHYDRRLGLAMAFQNGDFSGSGYPVPGSIFGSGFAGYEPPAVPIDTYTPQALMPWTSISMGSVPVGRAM